MALDKNQVLFGGKTRTLKYDIAAMISLESALDGKSTGEIVGSLANWNFTALVLALWAGLKHEEDAKKFTPGKVQKMLEQYVGLPGANLRGLRDDVRAAMEASSWYRQAISTDDEPATDAEDDEGEG